MTHPASAGVGGAGGRGAAFLQPARGWACSASPLAAGLPWVPPAFRHALFGGGMFSGLGGPWFVDLFGLILPDRLDPSSWFAAWRCHGLAAPHRHPPPAPMPAQTTGLPWSPGHGNQLFRRRTGFFVLGAGTAPSKIARRFYEAFRSGPGGSARSQARVGLTRRRQLNYVATPEMVSYFTPGSGNLRAQPRQQGFPTSSCRQGDSRRGPCARAIPTRQRGDAALLPHRQDM